MCVYISKNFIVEKTWNSCHFACDDRDFEERHKLNALGQRLLGVALQAGESGFGNFGCGKWMEMGQALALKHEPSH
jgi:hypothetical protein